jgi:hypothetical protein
MGMTLQDGTKGPYRDEFWWTMNICRVAELPAGFKNASETPDNQDCCHERKG